MLRNTKANKKALKLEMNKPENDGLSISQLAQKYDISYNSARKLIHEFRKDSLPMLRRKHRVPLKEKKKTVRDLYESSLSLQDFADNSPYSYSTINGWSRQYLSKKRHQEILGRTQRTADPVFTQRANDLYESGMSLLEFASKRGVHITSLGRWSRQHLSPEQHKEILKRTTRKRATKDIVLERKKLLEDLLASDHTIKEFAEKHDISYGTLYDWVRFNLTKKQCEEIQDRDISDTAREVGGILDKLKTAQELYRSGETIAVFSRKRNLDANAVLVWASVHLDPQEFQEVRSRGNRLKSTQKERETICKELYKSSLPVQEFVESYTKTTYPLNVKLLYHWTRLTLTKEQHKEIHNRSRKGRPRLRTEPAPVEQLDLWGGTPVEAPVSRMAATPRKTAVHNTDELIKNLQELTRSLQELAIDLSK